MSRPARGLRTLGTPHFDTRGRVVAWSRSVFWRPIFTVPRAELLALEVRNGARPPWRNGVRWPWLDPRSVVQAIRDPLGRRYMPDDTSRWRAERWLAALELTPRERAELLAYLTRGYL